MDRIERLIIQIIFLSISLLSVLYILFLIKYGKSRRVLTIFNLVAEKIQKKNRKRRTERYTARLYVRNSREKTSAVLSILLLLFISFVVMNHYITFVVVTSDSMAATVEKGDLVLVQSINKIPVNGEIIQFQVPSRNLPVLHRVHEITPAGYVTKGDFNPVPDDWIVRESQIQAKALILFGRPVIIPEIGEIFIVESRITRFGSEYGLISGVVNIFKVFAFIIFILAFLSIFETLIKIS